MEASHDSKMHNYGLIFDLRCLATFYPFLSNVSVVVTSFPLFVLFIVV